MLRHIVQSHDLTRMESYPTVDLLFWVFLKEATRLATSEKENKYSKSAAWVMEADPKKKKLPGENLSPNPPFSQASNRCASGCCPSWTCQGRDLQQGARNLMLPRSERLRPGHTLDRIAAC